MYRYSARHKRRTQTVQLIKQFCSSVDTNRYIDIVSVYCIGQGAVIYCLI